MTYHFFKKLKVVSDKIGYKDRIQFLYVKSHFEL